MGINRERVMSKISFIKEQLQSIMQLLEEKDDGEILNDQWLVKGLKYSLQVSIEAMIDIAYHISAKELNQAPVDARDAMQKLADGGLIPGKDLPIYRNMIGLRNRLVHGYQEVTPRRVLEIARNELDDFDRFIKQVSRVIKKNVE